MTGRKLRSRTTRINYFETSDQSPKPVQSNVSHKPIYMREKKVLATSRTDDNVYKFKASKENSASNVDESLRRIMREVDHGTNDKPKTRRRKADASADIKKQCNKSPKRVQKKREKKPIKRLPEETCLNRNEKSNIRKPQECRTTKKPRHICENFIEPGYDKEEQSIEKFITRRPNANSTMVTSSPRLDLYRGLTARRLNRLRTSDVHDLSPITTITQRRKNRLVHSPILENVQPVSSSSHKKTSQFPSRLRSSLVRNLSPIKTITHRRKNSFVSSSIPDYEMCHSPLSPKLPMPSSNDESGKFRGRRLNRLTLGLQKFCPIKMKPKETSLNSPVLPLIPTNLITPSSPRVPILDRIRSSDVQDLHHLVTRPETFPASPIAVESDKNESVTYFGFDISNDSIHFEHKPTRFPSPLIKMHKEKQVQAKRDERKWMLKMDLTRRSTRNQRDATQLPKLGFLKEVVEKPVVKRTKRPQQLNREDKENYRTAERRNKRTRKAIAERIKGAREFKKWSETFNSICVEVDQHVLEIE